MHHCSTLHSHMPKHTPTQFYKIAEKDGMKLRSGKYINCTKTTELSKDTFNLIMISEKSHTAFSIAHSRHGNGSVDIRGPGWISFFTSCFGKLVDEMVGGRFSPNCTRLYATERFISKWRNTINRYHSHDLKAVMCRKTEESIVLLGNMMQRRGQVRMCGCSDLERDDREDLIMMFYQAEGPGHLIINQDEDGIPFPTWVLTPEVSREQFEREFYTDQFEWRHDLQALKDRFEAHLSYFKRVPHKTYQEAYFALASRKINMDCAKNILSFL